MCEQNSLFFFYSPAVVVLFLLLLFFLLKFPHLTTLNFSYGLIRFNRPNHNSQSSSEISAAALPSSPWMWMGATGSPARLGCNGEPMTTHRAPWKDVTSSSAVVLAAGTAVPLCLACSLYSTSSSCVCVCICVCTCMYVCVCACVFKATASTLHIHGEISLSETSRERQISCGQTERHGCGRRGEAAWLSLLPSSLKPTELTS